MKKSEFRELNPGDLIKVVFDNPHGAESLWCIVQSIRFDSARVILDNTPHSFKAKAGDLITIERAQVIRRYEDE